VRETSGELEDRDRDGDRHRKEDERGALALAASR
jgi:hypothetical protein